jgi:hypothetical protein
MRNCKLGVGVMLLLVFVFTFTFGYYVAIDEAVAAPCACTFYCPYQDAYVGGKWYYPVGQPKICWSDDLNPNCACYPTK